ncbi:MAG: rhomboid family intramembrane serine protease [Clostridia bacterium]|nr:rhomboid family intramembrane serine protease [Clostridia bacterium]
MTENRKKGLRLTYNAPVVLTFVLLCVAAYLLNLLTGAKPDQGISGWTNSHLFSVHRASLLDPLTYVRLFGHVLGHSSWEHLLNNAMYLLILGPMIEEKYGSSNVLFVILATALAVGVIQMIFFDTAVLGASSVVFAFIILASITNMEQGTIPLTFILVVLLYIGQEVLNAFRADQVSQMAHIAGGVVGGALGIVMNKLGMSRRS